MTVFRPRVKQTARKSTGSASRPAVQRSRSRSRSPSVLNLDHASPPASSIATRPTSPSASGMVNHSTSPSASSIATRPTSPPDSTVMTVPAEPWGTYPPSSPGDWPVAQPTTNGHDWESGWSVDGRPNRPIEPLAWGVLGPSLEPPMDNRDNFAEVYIVANGIPDLRQQESYSQLDITRVIAFSLLVSTGTRPQSQFLVELIGGESQWVRAVDAIPVRPSIYIEYLTGPSGGWSGVVQTYAYNSTGAQIQIFVLP